MPPEQPTEASIEAAILRLAGDCGPNRSVSPSDVARALDADWHRLLGPVRRVAIHLARAGRIEILRKGRPVDPAAVKGVIRLRLPSSATAPGPAR